MRENDHRGALLFVGAASAAVAAWLWRCLCLFPWQLFNEVRLEPSFLVANGVSIYPGPASGPVTTWIYGPLSVLIYLPATLANTAGGALLAAGAINVLFVAAPLVVFCAAWPAAPSELSRRDRLVAVLLCAALWPASSFQHIQADNAVVACGLLANLVLVRNPLAGRRARWLAAAIAIGAIAAKQTAVEILTAQLVWFACREGWRSSLQQLGRAAACGAGLALAALAFFDPAGLWFNLFELPSRLPWVDSPLNRLGEVPGALAAQILVPAAIVAIGRRRLLARESVLLLPTLCWLAALPLGIASLLKIGGSINSLHGLLYFLPPAVLTALTLRRPSFPRFASMLALCTTLAVAVARLEYSPHRWTPFTEHLRQADEIAAGAPGRVWFPWNPLVTFYREHRFDHTEDGLYVRLLAGQFPPTAQLRRHLPPEWSSIALGPKGSDWGLAVDLLPQPRTSVQRGMWTIYQAPPKR